MARTNKAQHKADKKTLLKIYPNLIQYEPLPFERIYEFEDAQGRTLRRGDFIRVTTAPRSWIFKVRHLVRTPGGKEWIEAFGPYNKSFKYYTEDANRVPKYRAFRLDEVAAKVRR